MKGFSNRCYSGTELDEEHGASGHVDGVHAGVRGLVGDFAPSPETPPMIPAGLSEEEAVQDLGDYDVTSDDWLDVSHAIREADHE